MRVLLIGSTGVLGRPAVRRLLADGHQVSGLARNTDRAAAIAEQGITPVVGDLFDPDSLSTVLPGHEAVLNLATRIPSPGKAAFGVGWAANDRVRRDGSAALVTAALACADVRVIVQEGISFLYADAGDAEITEESPVDVASALRSSVTAHENVARFADAGDGRVGVRLRIAFLMGDDPLTAMLLRGARFGLPVTYGDPDGWMTSIQPADAATGAVAALNAPSGIYNVGGQPIRKREMGAVLATAAGVRKGRSMPAGLTRLLGPASVFGRSQRITSAKLTDTTGWQPGDSKPNQGWFETIKR
jgi:nucleoside-diphosphate-sugar epimerase